MAKRFVFTCDVSGEDLTDEIAVRRTLVINLDESGNPDPNGVPTTVGLDLSAQSASEFDRALAPYLRAASTKVTRKRAVGGTGSKAGKPSQAAAIREWAREQGYDVSARGRIDQDVMDAYAAAHAVDASSEGTATDE